jgi:hypothetical protein
MACSLEGWALKLVGAAILGETLSFLMLADEAEAM